jgi:hypothetical protein
MTWHAPQTSNGRDNFFVAAEEKICGLIGLKSGENLRLQTSDANALDSLPKNLKKIS